MSNLFDKINGLLKHATKEVEKYREKILLNKPSMEVTGEKVLEDISETALEIEFTLLPGKAKQAGIKLLRNGDNETSVFYDAMEQSVKLNRTKSGNTTFSDKFQSIESVKIPDVADSISYRILIDKDIVEDFINGGKQVITDLVFPVYEGGQSVFFNDMATAEFHKVKIWKMKGSMQDR